MVHEIGLTPRFIQIGFEIVDKRFELRTVMVMTGLIARLFPDQELERMCHVATAGSSKGINCNMPGYRKLSLPG